MDSRVDSTLAVGQRDRACRPSAGGLAPGEHGDDLRATGTTPPTTRHGLIGGDGAAASRRTGRSACDIATAVGGGPAAGDTAARPARSRCASALVMSPDRGGVFDVPAVDGASRARRTGGRWAAVRVVDPRARLRAVAIDLLAQRYDLAGPVNLASPEPAAPARADARPARAWGRRLPATRAMAEVGAWALRSDTELLLKSRRVVPGRLLEEGFVFDYPTWPERRRISYADALCSPACDERVVLSPGDSGTMVVNGVVRAARRLRGR